MENRRKFHEPKLLIASHNRGKIEELTQMLHPFGIEVISARDLDIQEPEETGDTFEENSRLKALYYAKAMNLPALADDSGLCIKALDGAPGIFSARWAGPDQDYPAAMTRIQEGLGEDEDRSAEFACVLTLAWPDGHTEVFEGHIEGEIVVLPRGENGFGYDPIFLPIGSDKTFAEMPPLEKQIMSHRARALEVLIEDCIAE